MMKTCKLHFGCGASFNWRPRYVAYFYSDECQYGLLLLTHESIDCGPCTRRGADLALL
jgi:hypothetical protein